MKEKERTNPNGDCHSSRNRKKTETDGTATAATPSTRSRNTEPSAPPHRNLTHRPPHPCPNQKSPLTRVAMDGARDTHAAEKAGRGEGDMELVVAGGAVGRTGGNGGVQS